MEFKKASTEIVKMEVGQEFIGIFKEQSTRPWIDEEGVEKEITQYHFLKVDNKGKEIPDTKTVLFADSGLQNLWKTENVKAGTVVKIVKLEKITRGKKQINQYELYTAQ